LKHTVRIVVAAMALGALPFCSPRAAVAAKPPAKAAAQNNNPLGLSAAQRQKLMALDKKAQAEATAIQKGKGTDAQKRTKFAALAKKYDGLRMAILTPAQRQKVAVATAAHRRRGEQTAAVAKTLTPTQKKKMDGFRGVFVKKVQALAADKSLTDAQKRAKYIALERTLEAQIDGILTTTQKAAMKKIR
jgi:hypothetical protein